MSKKDTRAEIFRAAAILFHQRGFNATSMRQLADQVGIEASSLYNHIQSKSELLNELCSEIAGLFLDSVNRIRESDSSVRQKLNDIVDLHIQLAKTRPEAMTAFNREWLSLEEKALRRFKRQRRVYSAMIEQILEEGQRSNEVRSMDTYIMMNTLLSGLNWLFFVKRSYLKANERTLAKDLKDLIGSAILTNVC